MIFFVKKNIVIGILISIICLLLAFIFVEFSLKIVKEPSQSPITLEDIQNGVLCSSLVSSSISNGANSEDYNRIYSSLKARRLSRQEFSLTLNPETDTLTKIIPSIDEGTYGHETIYQIVSDSENQVGFTATSSEEQGNKYNEQLIVEEFNYRFFRISDMEGRELRIERGTCRPK